MALYLRGGVYHYDFAVNGKRYRGTTKQKVLSRARQFESALIHQAQTDELPIIRRKVPTLFENSERFFGWVASAPLERNTKMYYQHGWRVLQKTPLLNMRMD